MKRRAGLSLVELTVVMLVVGIIGAVGSLKFADALATHRANATAQFLCESLKECQRRARLRSTPVTVTIVRNQTKYTITGLPNPNHPGQPNVVDLAVMGAGTQLKITNNYTVSFNGFGHPTTAVLIELKASGHSKYVRVDPATGTVALTTL